MFVLSCYRTIRLHGQNKQLRRKRRWFDYLSSQMPRKKMQKRICRACKSYRSYYKYKHGTKQNHRSTNIKTPKWNFSQIQKHLLTYHAIQSFEEIQSDDDNLTSEEHDAYAMNTLPSREENVTSSKLPMHTEQSQVDFRTNNEQGKRL